jgi:hypothetical protein
MGLLGSIAEKCNAKASVEPVATRDDAWRAIDGALSGMPLWEATQLLESIAANYRARLAATLPPGFRMP